MGIGAPGVDGCRGGDVGAVLAAHRLERVARRLSEEDYLKRGKELANVVCDEALGGLTYLPADDDQTPLQRASNELARNPRMSTTRATVASMRT